MAALKGRISKPLNRNEDRLFGKTAGVKGFKVYVDDLPEACTGGSNDMQQKTSAKLPGRKSVTFTGKNTQAMASKFKGGAKSLENQRVKRDNSISVNVGRRVLADVSNLRGNSLRSNGQDGLKQPTTVAKVLPNTRKPSLLLKTRKVDSNASDEKGGAKTSENQKVTRDSSISVKVGRRVLGDVSNLRGNSLKTKGQDGSKHMLVFTVSKSKSQKEVATVDPSLRRGSANWKPSVGYRGSNIQGRGSLNTDCRINSRIPLPPTRKSMPVSRLPIQVGAGIKKATTGNKEKGTNGIHGFPVKAKVDAKAMAQVTNARNHLLKNRVSDGFIIMGSKGRSAANNKDLLRKPVKPIVETTTLKSKDNKVSSLSSTNKAAEEQHSVDEASSESGENTSRNKLGNDVAKKSRRRKSFTSLLMEKSKMQNEKGQCLEQNLPSIYDDDNPIEVSEYVDEIYHYHWTMEAQCCPLVNYMEMQSEITPPMRGILINWLIEVHEKFDLMPESLYLTITLLDRYLSLVSIRKNELQLVGLTALLLASKYEDFWHPRVAELISISVESYTRNQVLEMEKNFLKTLKFRLNAPTPYTFMLRFLKASDSDKKLEDLSFYLIDLCMIDYQGLRFKSSLLCASAIYVARCTLEIPPPWSQLLRIYSHYDESQLRDCAEMVLKVQKSAKTSKLNVTYEKYSRPENSQVAKIRPMNKLPQLNMSSPHKVLLIQSLILMRK